MVPVDASILKDAIGFFVKQMAMIHEMSSIVYSLVLVFTESSGLVFCYSAVECILMIIASLFETVRIKVSL